MVYAEFGGQTECIMGNWKIENSRRRILLKPHFFFKLNRPSGHTKPMNPLTETASFSNRSPEWVKDDVTRDHLHYSIVATLF